MTRPVHSGRAHRSRAGARFAIAIAVAGAALAAAPPAAAVSRARQDYLAAELAAARSRKLYLVLDPHGPALDLKVDGFLLHRFAAQRALFGRTWGSGRPAWPALSFELVSDLPEPDRQPIPIRARGAAAAEPAPESLRRVPSRYRLRFAPALEVTVAGEPAGFDLAVLCWRIGRRLGEGWQTVGDRFAGRPVPPHLLLLMPAGEARRLLLSLRSGTRLLIAVPE